MAIQLNERDHLIFKMIDEHKVLLEKHISWFISQEEKPVLIRDRLRKLFYLDYLLCQRHNTKLPWWTTPTKPLVYMLSPVSKIISGTTDEEIDLFDSDVQRHLLEVANIRMLGLIAQKEGEIKGFNWITCSVKNPGEIPFDAIVGFNSGAEATMHKIGIINHPSNIEQVLAALPELLRRRTPVHAVLFVARDDQYLQELKTAVGKMQDKIDPRQVMFVTHQNLYQLGLAKACGIEIANNVSDTELAIQQSTSWTDLSQARAS